MVLWNWEMLEILLIYILQFFYFYDITTGSLKANFIFLSLSGLLVGKRTFMTFISVFYLFLKE